MACLAAALLAAAPASGQDAQAAQISVAAADGNIGTVTRVLDAGFDVNTRWGVFDQFALLKAAEWGQLDMVRLLLRRGANPLLRDSSGRTARDWARNNGHSEVERILREAEGALAEPTRTAPASPAAPPHRPASGTPAPAPAPTPAAPPTTAAPAPSALPADTPRDGEWRGTIEGITRGGTQYVAFRVSRGRIVESTFHVDYHCAPQYSYRERGTVGFEEPIPVTRGQFNATRKAPAVELNVAGRFPTPTTAEGTFKMEDSQLCTTRLVRWTARRTGA